MRAHRRIKRIYANQPQFHLLAVKTNPLKKKWHAGKQLVDRDTFVQRGLERYDGSIRRKLILGVYIVPVGVIAVIIYLTNFT